MNLKSLPLPAEVFRGSRAELLPRSRALWFVIGFFSALTLAGYVAGLWPNP